tara:strand:+ start:496 stop:732 length:237 start_codon:yes stop_codon:yes gene_type:complete
MVDTVNLMKYILDQRAPFQAHKNIHTLGESKTDIYFYEVWLHPVPFVVTVNMSAKWDSQRPSLRENMIKVFLDDQCYY